ncbi:SURF1 family protein [Rhizobium sp. 9140]|uniref:SURF1 family protein n=1 Tax=Rhizobium sp. 9140 TaxID=1761900 RepID=UPI0007965733|nr:SURF1 family protein [Rhizobium sp. 9140]CZT34439.1 surfeit locus 1 family protein [Rhizobium sp. 9140]
MPGPAKSTVAEPASAAGTTPRRGGPVARLFSAVLLLALFAALVSLGTWQMQRLHWKEGLLAAIAERRTAPPVDVDAIAAMVAAGEDIEYRTVRVSGVFENGGERHFFATYNGQTGFYVYTPLTLTDGRAVLINRGFVPYERKDPATRPGSQPEGPVTLSGLARARLDAKPSWVVPENDITKNIFYWKDWTAMTTASGLSPARTLPFFIDADATPNSDTLPVGGVTQFDLPNNHLQYALTWYGLAAALIAVSGLFVVRRRAEARAGQAAPHHRTPE